jgi:hypothetical protein
MQRLIDAAASFVADIIIRIIGRPEPPPARRPRFDSPYAQMLARERPLPNDLPQGGGSVVSHLPMGRRS